MVSDLVPIGTRVILLASVRPGVVTAVRREPYLKPYVVTCDDGSSVFASAYELGREEDPTRTPLGPRLERY